MPIAAQIIGTITFLAVIALMLQCAHSAMKKKRILYLEARVPRLQLPAPRRREHEIQ